MEELLKKIYPYDKDKLITEILDLYERQWYVISNFVYFSIIKQQKLFESNEKKKSTLQKEYKKSILKWDFLLPDWVALQTFYRLASTQIELPVKSLSNLNGTDFIPYLLDDLKKKFWSNRLEIYLYWAKPEIVELTKKRLEYKWFNIVFTHDWFSDLNWNDVPRSQNENPIKVLLVARSTVTNPIQELWTQKNYSKIKENNFIVFTVWWLFDFIAAEWNEHKKWSQKRAPMFIRKIKLEWLWRFITDPKRNYKKVKNSLALFPYIFKYLILKKE